MAAEVRLPALRLPGLSPDSLGNYLASLGLLRVLSRKWPSTRIAWRDDVLRVVGGPSTLDELLDELVRVASERAWTAYDRRWNEEQKKGTKAKSGLPLALWQAAADERELQVFAAHAVPHARVSFNPLFGSGGNAGKRAFSKGWAKAIEALAPSAPDAKEPKKNETEKQKAAREKRENKALKEYQQEGPARQQKNRDELESLLLGRPLAWLVEELVAGSWFSQATKLYNSGQSPAREGQISPWAMVLACEGLALLAGGPSRRLGARSRAIGAFPFITQPIAASAEKEADRLRGEFWTPLWTRPMTLAEASTLFSRGRAELHGRGALTPAAFATAIRERGVDAGVSEFRRFTLGRTTSNNTFEPRLEARFVLNTDAGAAGAATSLTLKRATALIEHRGFHDAKHFIGLRGPIEAALLDVAADPGRSEAAITLLDAIAAALDRIDRNRGFRDGKVRWEPLPLGWLPSLFAGEQPGAEAWLAMSLVSAFPPALPFAAFRFGVDWAREKHGKYEYNWATKPAWFEHSKVAPARWVWGPGELARLIGAVLSRRLLEEAKLEGTQTTRPLGRAPLPVTTVQVRQWLDDDLDESLFSAWLSRLALFDWRRVPQEVRALIQVEIHDPAVDGELALLGLVQPLVDQRCLFVRDLSTDDLLADETGARTTESACSLVTLIRAGNFDAAQRLARSRYAIAGARLASFEVPWAVHDPDRLVAALLFTISDRDRAILFERWLRPRRRQQGGEGHV
jgi:CRISPR-associated protein Csx17